MKQLFSLGKALIFVDRKVENFWEYALDFCRFGPNPQILIPHKYFRK